MSIREALAFGGTIKLVDEQIFTESGTWEKPEDILDADVVVVEIWSGGGAGASGNGSTPGRGGGGGGYFRVENRAVHFPSSAVVAVGAEATTPGVVGNSSLFGHILVTGGTSNGAGGSAFLIGDWVPGEAGFSTTPGGSVIYGGGGAGTGVSGASRTPGNSIYGGGGGASGSGNLPGGTSEFGGNGGAGSANLGQPGQPGQAPGGGGGGGGASTTGSGPGGLGASGARGEVRVRVWRGI